MTLLTFLVVVLSFLGSACSEEIPFDEVAPFPEVKNDSLLNRLALKFKPQLYISSGCYPYPAVDAEGNTNAGIRNLRFLTDCDGSPLGSQVYGHAAKVKGYVGFMFAWYFPRDVAIPTVYIGHHHGWEHIIVWLSSLSENAKLLSVTLPSMGFSYTAYSLPTHDQMDGSHVKLKYKSWLYQTPHYLEPTHKAGTYQDLIMWDNMTDAAREALDDTTFFFHRTPISTGKFEEHIHQAYPF